MKYFLHDTSAFDDEKISELFIEFGYEGLGLFYTILEKLAKQEKPVKTSVLKHQLKVGKKLDKCWKFMESLEILSSNNGETFNKQLLNFSEKYQVKKEKNAKRISEWRKNQEYTENVTHYKSVSNTSKVKESKVKESNIYIDFLEKFNNSLKRNFKILDNKTKSQLNARIKEGFTIEEILLAAQNCSKDQYHIENPQYLTPEFITRSDKLQKYLNAITPIPQQQSKKTIPDKIYTKE